MQIGDTAEAKMEVRLEDTARALSLESGDEFPEVFATSRMIALMELAAARLMRPLLGDDQLSVGVGVDVRHLAATPVGLLRMTDKITSRFTAEYRLTTEVTPWHAVSASVTLHTDRGKAFDEPAAQWNMTISAPDEISIDARSSDEGEEFRGIQDFVAAVLRWIEPLRL